VTGQSSPILLDFPDSFESERLLIRGPRPGDGAAVHAALIESLGELRPWLHRIHWEVPAFEIGYWIRTSEAGRGYATEATRRIAEFAFDDLGAERVEIWCDARNERSAAVARRAGFAFEARLNRHRRDTSGALSDSLCFVRFRG
jgi:hypothetical protein